MINSKGFLFGGDVYVGDLCGPLMTAPRPTTLDDLPATGDDRRVELAEDSN